MMKKKSKIPVIEPLTMEIKSLDMVNLLFFLPSVVYRCG
jgi:hypothetical protein